ncbi:uncharacterized protein LOC129601196 [Paramacrobiotus metropolitanus]|uniref:uncharacterized protein LOC129601196 n=1 Tax=Paramacrobiotus metropolitanus TaxID=2943436 RepID=UPI002445B391|nr:uncharacterized protein LOC129601196 [Paramacrobiotus metropolitanus]
MIGIIIISMMVLLGLAGFKYWRFRRRQAKTGHYTNLDKEAPISPAQVPAGSYQNAPVSAHQAVPPDVPAEVMIDLEKALRSTPGEKSKLFGTGKGNYQAAAGETAAAPSPTMRTTADLVMAYVRSFTD